MVAYVGDFEQRTRLPEALLQSLYDLTPAEARIASMLAKGISPREISEELELSRHTVRNQLKSVFLKTGTSRQGELISMLLSSAAAPAAEPGVEGTA